MDNERKFRVIWIIQSDGVYEWRNPKTMKMEMNAPPKTKLLNSHRGEMVYEELDFHDKRHKEWRKKLGTLLVQDSVEGRMGASRDADDLGECPVLLLLKLRALILSQHLRNTYLAVYQRNTSCSRGLDMKVRSFARRSLSMAIRKVPRNDTELPENSSLILPGSAATFLWTQEIANANSVHRLIHNELLRR